MAVSSVPLSAIRLRIAVAVTGANLLVALRLATLRFGSLQLAAS